MNQTFISYLSSHSSTKLFIFSLFMEFETTLLSYSCRSTERSITYHRNSHKHTHIITHWNVNILNMMETVGYVICWYLTRGSKNLDSVISSGGFSCTALNCSLFLARILAWYQKVGDVIDFRQINRRYRKSARLPLSFEGLEMVDLTLRVGMWWVSWMVSPVLASIVLPCSSRIRGVGLCTKYKAGEMAT